VPRGQGETWWALTVYKKCQQEKSGEMSEAKIGRVSLVISAIAGSFWWGATVKCQHTSTTKAKATPHSKRRM
jgi:hypothetical protein